jgi:hypothetical protein
MANDEAQHVRDSDRAKLHAEVNLLGNQRYLITAAVVTIIAIVLPNLFPKTSISQPSQMVGSCCSMVALLVLSIALVHQNQCIYAQIRIIVSYLVVKGWSQWEIEWKQFKKDRHPVEIRHIPGSLSLIFYLADTTIFLAWIFNLFVFVECSQKDGFIWKSLDCWFVIVLLLIAILLIALLTYRIPKSMNVDDEYIHISIWEHVLKTPTPIPPPSERRGGSNPDK